MEQQVILSQNSNVDKEIDFSSYAPIHDKQAQFHKSPARHRLLMGGLRSGKTYPAQHEGLWMAYDNPNHYSLWLRNEWKDLEDFLEKPTVDLSSMYGAHRFYDKENHDLHLWNGHIIQFRPLSLGIRKFKGASVSFFFIDDPDVNVNWDVCEFMFSRLTNAPGSHAKYFKSLWTSNWEGENAIWDLFMRDKNEGEGDDFAYWVFDSRQNTSLDPNWLKDLQRVHSDDWIKRYVLNDIFSFSGLLYSEFNRIKHTKDLSWCKQDHKLIKIMAIDTGLEDPDVILNMACDGTNVYVYGEYYKKGERVTELGHKIIELNNKETDISNIIIDPSCAKTEKTSGSSVKRDLSENLGITLTYGNNNRDLGIELVKTLLTIREDKEANLFIDTHSCPHLIDEIRKVKKGDVKNDHCLDALRYGCMFFKDRRILKHLFHNEQDYNARIEAQRQDRYNKLRYYRDLGQRFRNRLQAEHTKAKYIRPTRSYTDTTDIIAIQNTVNMANIMFKEKGVVSLEDIQGFVPNVPVEDINLALTTHGFKQIEGGNFIKTNH